MNYKFKKIFFQKYPVFLILMFALSCSKSAVKNMLQGKNNKGDIAKLSDSKKIVKKSNYQEEEQKVDNTDDDVEDSTDDEKEYCKIYYSNNNNNKKIGDKNYNKDKTLKQLTKELKEINKDNPKYLASIDRMNKDIIEIKKTFISGYINTWEKIDIQKWAKKIKNRTKNITEILAVVCRAVELDRGYLPRDVQLFSLLSLLYRNGNQGRLAQIYTGEGKTLTIAMLAIVNALKGHKVDIVTSSKVLAKRDAKENKELYSYLNITTADNSYKNMESPSNRDCYSEDIVYGAPLQFEADVLYDEYMRYNTRAKRAFDIVIVDEVDNMLIDERLRTTLLSTPIPGMSVLNTVLEHIWYIINNISKNIPKNLDPIDSLNYIISYLIEEQEKNKVTITNFMNFCVPEYLREYTEKQLFIWCRNAAHAKFLYKENEHYKVVNKNIVPIDYKNTGVWQRNMAWGDGLHQFLFLKHNLFVRQINLTTNFLSNVSFIRRYGKNILGLTGTLGSETEQKLLKDLYGLDTIHIPSFKQRKLKELPGIISKNEQEWLKDIKKSVLQEVKKGRASLIICETIADTFLLKEVLKESYDEDLINLYIEGNEEEATIFDNEIQPGQIVIATNLAGRGTDLKISEHVKNKGGLYVVTTYMPENIRVERQAFGRAGRKGDPGDARLIINKLNLKDSFLNCKTINEIKQKRDKKEKKYLQIATKEIKKKKNIYK